MKISPTEHFDRKKSTNQDTRVIIFSQWRDSVEGIVSMLKAQHDNTLKPSPFIGQSKKSSGDKKSNNSEAKGQDSAGMNQVQQQRVLEQFRKGTFNILVCTCVAEEVSFWMNQLVHESHFINARQTNLNTGARYWRRRPHCEF
jgi:ERCC4-related helicase